MTWTLRPPRALAALLVLALVSLNPDVQASHYRLGPDFKLLSGDEVKRLAAAGLNTSAQLLNATAKKRDRRKLAKKTGLSVKRLTTLAYHCDLLRVGGLGPSAVLLLDQAGVSHSAALGRTKAGALHAKLVVLNTGPSNPVIPAKAELIAWIAEAKALAPLVEGAR